MQQEGCLKLKRLTVLMGISIK